MTFYKQLEEWGAIVTDTQIDKQPDQSMKYRLGLKLRSEIKGEMINDFISRHSEVVSFKLTRLAQDA